MSAEASYDVVVLGAGQAGLAVGYHLQRAGLVPGDDFVLVDAADRPGGSWPRMWDGLRLFSPATYSSLPGWLMPPWDDAARGFPPRDHVVAYLRAYEERYRLAPLRPHRVRAVRRADDDPSGPLIVESPGLTLAARHVVSATGTWDQPFWPTYPGANDFLGTQLHSSTYRRPEELAGQRVVVVGGGNSAAQVLAEVSTVAEVTWVTQRPPRFLPDDVDGRVLFETATARVQAQREGRAHDGVGGLGDIVMVASVREARGRGVLEAEPMFERLVPDGIARADGRTLSCDAVIWCTGFRPALRHLAPLHMRDDRGRVPVSGAAGTRSAREPRVHLVGYGDWVGAASATLIGVGRSAKATVAEIVDSLQK
ncbi:NAD(P)/FAD-dependent oxidoreductase [Nocardioides sp. HDW12B]|uniref:ArsO family NAD(P)H-dependent flavin-containing monooxygenase n=1 Tax=Nocardioides sp. HDW12B TaxID=2714939 RepID=UPI00140D4B6E|nr:ArsO family NAD(P)H-dependent flavin-containing monooxygenase [Nocardioides sp. HDW12B]QIK68237.1 NAD(P)/FAD-dependent oxidoreductase [Nocardioides sp. HDW12B]